MMNLLPVISRLVLLLLAVAALTLQFAPWVRIPGRETTIYIGTGIYLLLVLIELVMNIGDARASRDTTRLSFNYLTKSILFRRLIMFVILVAVAIITFMHTNSMSLRTLVMVVVALEAITFPIRWATGYYRVVIAPETLSIIGDQQKIAHHSRIKDVEFRYEIFFFRMKDDNVYDVHLLSLKKEDQKTFVQAISRWLSTHNIPVTKDGAEKLQSFQ